MTREYPPHIVGGIATHTFHLREHLSRLGVEAHVVSFGNPASGNSHVTFVRPASSIIDRENRGALPNSAVPYDLIRFTLLVREMLKRGGYDILHVQEPYVGGLLTAKNKVTTIHDTSLGELDSMKASGLARKSIVRAGFYLTLGLAMERASIANSRAIVVPSEQVREELVNRYGADSRKVHTIGNGVEPFNRYMHLSKEEAKEKLGIRDGKTLVFTTGQHVARKRFDILLQACQLLGKNGSLDGYDVRIAGDGPLTNPLISQAASLGLDGNVSFVNWLGQAELELHYRAADLFVVSSDYESGPIAMLEAMTAGTPTISTRIPGFAALSKHGEEAYLVPRRDPSAMAGAIELLADDEGLRLRIAEGGRNFAGKFSWDKVARQTLALYERMVMS